MLKLKYIFNKGDNMGLKTMKCPNCNATLEYDPISTILQCDFCDSTIVVNDVNANSNAVNGTDYNGTVAPTETVAFEPNQIKNIDDVNPTENNDIRKSLSSANEEQAPGRFMGEDVAYRNNSQSVQDNTVSFKCPTCAEPLKYDPENNVLMCEHCGNTFDIGDIKDTISQTGDTGFQWGDYKQSMSDEEIPNTVSYVCKSCGAEIIADGTTAATKCPYCDNVVVVSDKIEGILKPNGIIPFRIDKNGLKDAIANYCKGKKLLPKNFLSEHKIREVQGVYVPFWLYDCHADGNMSFEGKRVREWSDSEYEYTEISYYLINCDGDMSFAKIPVDGSIKMDDALMDSIEPFDYSGIVDFKPEYLSGFLADRFDVDADASLPRATDRVKNSVAELFRSTVVDFASVIPISSNIELDQTNVNYVLLPVYLIRSKYQGQDYTFAVNGQTGKVTGNLPYSKGKYYAYLAGIASAIFAVGGTILSLLFPGGLF